MANQYAPGIFIKHFLHKANFGPLNSFVRLLSGARVGGGAQNGGRSIKLGVA